MFKKLGFIGCGKMSSAIGLSLVKKGVIKPKEISVSCPEENLLEKWKELGCQTTVDNGKVIEASETIIWAVKPQVFPHALKETEYNGTAKKFHVSIMAGIPLSQFTDSISNQFKHSQISTGRAMPNIAMQVQCGCAGLQNIIFHVMESYNDEIKIVYTMDKSASPKDKELLSTLLSSLGLSFEVPEAQINAYCGLFSSGVGFMFPIIEGLSDGAVKMGIPRDLSLQIAAQTMKGAAQLILGEDRVHPGVMKDAVCSPGGTTIAGIAKLEKFGVRHAFIEAVEEATLKGEQLGKSGKTSSSS